MEALGGTEQRDVNRIDAFGIQESVTSSEHNVILPKAQCA